MLPFHRFTSIAEALQGIDIPSEIKATLALIDVPYISFDGIECVGQVVLHKDLADETKEIFNEIYNIQFPIQKIIPIAAYNWDDDASMADNNSSAFNYRMIVGTNRLSNHSLGRAIDINPMQNPYFAYNGKVYPEGAEYRPETKGALNQGGEVVAIFKSHGWTWLGEREKHQDYQHFEKLT